MTADQLLRPKKRNRQPKPEWSYAGLDAEKWRSESERVKWAQTTPQFRDILTVAINEAQKLVLNVVAGASENEALGEARGAFKIVEKLQSLAGGEIPQTPPLEKPDYPPED